MKFPEPTVDIDEIKQKYHVIEQEEGNDKDRPDGKKKKGKKRK
jgi:hypothetical protein